MKYTLLILLVIFCFAAQSGTAIELKPVPLTDEPGEFSKNGSFGNALFACFGNWTIHPAFFAPGQDYALLFSPAQQAPECPVGVRFGDISMAFNLDGEYSFEVQVMLWDAVDDGTGCLVPGDELCASTVYTIAGTASPGNVYYIGLPLDNCDCATVGDNYFIGWRILSVPAPPMAYFSSHCQTGSCASYLDGGAGWQDVIADLGHLGQSFIWGDYSCCDMPVDTEKATWGKVRALYR